MRSQSRRAEHLKYKYGITELRYEQMLEDQDGLCAVCRIDTPGPGMTYFHIDHDHVCCPGRYTCGQCVRGLLCQNCNIALGAFRDSEVILSAASSYVIRHRKRRLRVCLK